MNQNIIHSTTATDVAGAIEPITPAEAKLHAAIDFTEYDSLVGVYISAAREMIERATGYALVEKSIVSVASLTAEYSLELTFAPLKTLTHIKPISKEGVVGAALTSDQYAAFGTVGANISVKTPGMYEIAYVAKFDQVPASLKLACLYQFNHIFINRGDSGQAGTFSKEAMQVIEQWQRFVA